MASKAIEDVHVDQLNKLFVQSGLECSRTRRASLDSGTLETEIEEHGTVAEEPVTVPEDLSKEEEKLQIEEEEHIIALPEIFPSPSLRMVLPDKIRKIQEQNRIHVLPEVFKSDIDLAAIPKIMHTAQQKYIDTLAEMVGCKDYKSSMAEFWFLDTLANLLRRAQEDDLDRPTQAVLILWFCEWMKEMQHFDAAHRERMLRRFKDNMLAAAKFVAVENHLPVPCELDVYYKAVNEPTEGSTATRSTSPETRHNVTFEGGAFECSLRDLTKIIHYIFDLFSTEYQYNLVRSVFTFTPDYVPIETPYQLQNPKRMYAPIKVKAKKEKSPKKESKTSTAKGKKVPDTEEFLALMELKAKEERELEEKDQRDREDYNLRSHILPLNFATTDELFDKYWPPLTPEPEPEPEPEVKKGKKGKK